MKGILVELDTQTVKLLLEWAEEFGFNRLEIRDILFEFISSYETLDKQYKELLQN